jgi:hypothetical protein
MRTYEKDLENSEIAEKRVFNILKRFHSDVIGTDKYSIIDFISHKDKLIFELKSRNCSHNKYPTTLIGYNKLQYADTHDYNFIMLFFFNDGLYYCNYSDKLNYELKKFKRNDISNYSYQEKEYAFIPINQLSKFNLISGYQLNSN